MISGRKIIVVGSGVAGATIAKELLERCGSDHVWMLEAGPRIEMRNRRKWQDFVTANALPYIHRYDRPAEYESSPQSMTLQGARLFVRGGSTVHWGGWSPRFKPEDFALKSAADRELDWPLQYDDIEPYYHRAEYALGVAGDSSDDDPPRFGKRFPFEAVPFCEPDGPVIRALQNKNYSFAHLPIARFGDRCVTTGTCDYCPVGGRYSADMTLDEIQNEPRFELYLNSAVQRILLHDKKRVAGVEYLDMSTGRTQRMDGDVVVLCAGAIETPKLLLASANTHWPQGVGNDTGHVGKHFKVHPLLIAEGVVPRNSERVQQELDFPTLCSREFDCPAEQRAGKFFFVRASSDPSLKVERLMSEGLPIAGLDARTRGAMKFVLTGFVEQFAPPENEIRLGRGAGRFGLPRTEIGYVQDATLLDAVRVNLRRMQDILTAMEATETVGRMGTTRADHATSTCRMSASAAEGVVDARLALHDMDNLFVCSNAVFPNIAAVNPTLTLAALAFRLAQHLSLRSDAPAEGARHLAHAGAGDRP